MQGAYASTTTARAMPCNRAARLALGGLCLGAFLLTAGCQTREDRLIPFDGYRYKVKASAVDKKTSRAVFTATIRDVSQSLSGARKAGQYEGIRYCIKEYGTSKIDWTVGPDTSAGSYTIVDDTLSFSGKCAP